MYIKNTKIRKRIDEIQEKLENENNCKYYSQVLEKLNDDELLQLYTEKFLVCKDFVFNRNDAIKELEALHNAEFDESCDL